MQTFKRWIKSPWSVKCLVKALPLYEIADLFPFSYTRSYKCSLVWKPERERLASLFFFEQLLKLFWSFLYPDIASSHVKKEESKSKWKEKLFSFLYKILRIILFLEEMPLDLLLTKKDDFCCCCLLSCIKHFVAREWIKKMTWYFEANFNNFFIWYQILKGSLISWGILTLVSLSTKGAYWFWKSHFFLSWPFWIFFKKKFFLLHSYQNQSKFIC